MAPLTDKPVRSISEFEKTYFPTVFKARQVAAMFRAEYLGWYTNTPKAQRDLIIKELHYIADEHLRARNRILNNLRGE